MAVAELPSRDPTGTGSEPGASGTGLLRRSKSVGRIKVLRSLQAGERRSGARSRWPFGSEPASTGARSASDASGVVASVGSLSVSFPRAGRTVRALRGVDVEVGRGEIVALVGESGSGKSVLGLSLLGLLPANASIDGRVEVCGLDMVTAPPEARRVLRRRSLGAVFQDPMTSLNPTMRIGRQVAEAAGSIDEATRLLEQVGVPRPKERLRAYPHQLSGGLRQRVMIAMAIAGSPELVVADEPTTALDVTVQAQILDLIVRLRDELGTSFVFVTHDLGVAASIADRVVVLYGGKVAETGPASAVLAEPAHPYTRGLLGSRLELRPAAQVSRPAPLQGSPIDPADPPAGCPFEPRCPEADDRCLQPPSLVALDAERAAACFLVDSPGHRAGAEGTDCSEPVLWASQPKRPEAADGGARLQSRLARPPVVAAETEMGLGSRSDPSLVLRMEAVTCSFAVGRGRRAARLQALRGVDLSVAAGEAIAVVGESGCGKSTLLRVAAGLTQADGGRVDLPAGDRPQMVFQDAGASLTPWLSVGELLADRLRAAGTPRPWDGLVAASLERVGLRPELARARARELSGGQRQRVALARATIVPPAVLLCDEPTSALDVSLARTVLELLGELRRELGMAMVFVTHDLAVARAVAEEIVVMYLGKVVEAGPIEAVLYEPRHPYTRALVEAVPSAGRRPRPLAGEPASPLAVPSGCSFRPRCPLASTICDREPVLAASTGAEGRSVACHVPVEEPELVGSGAGRGSR